MRPVPRAPAAPPAPAGLLRRLAALGYDVLLLAALLFGAAALAVAVAGGEAIAPGSTVFQGYLVAVVVAYYAWFWTRAGYTPGMRPWRLRVVRDDGAPFGWADALRRCAAGTVSMAPAGLGFAWAKWDPQALEAALTVAPALAMAGFVWAAVDREGRMWHDRLSATRTVRDTRLDAASQPAR